MKQQEENNDLRFWAIMVLCWGLSILFLGCTCFTTNKSQNNRMFPPSVIRLIVLLPILGFSCLGLGFFGWMGFVCGLLLGSTLAICVSTYVTSVPEQF